MGNSSTPEAMDHRFQVGSNYENEKGPFRVLAIQGEWMLIEWDGGEQLKTKVAFQEKIQERMEKEALQHKAEGPRKAPAWMGRSFTGLQPTDFKDDVTGTHWRSREQLGGAVAKLIDSSEPMNSWSIYRRPEIHWAAISRYGSGEAWVEAKFFIRLDDERGTFGYYVERSNQPDDSKIDWLEFLNWLAKSENASWLHQTMIRHSMRIFDPYGGEDQAFSRTIDAGAEVWKVTFPTGKTEDVGIHEIAGYLSTIPDKHWLNLMIGHRVTADELVSQGAGVASTIAECFNVLLPIYENRTP